MSSQSAARRGPLAWLRNAPIRRKLAIIIVIPLATVAALAALRLADNVSEANSATNLHRMVGLSQAASVLTDDLAHERIAAAQYMNHDGVSAKDYTAAVRTTDADTMDYHDMHHKLGDVPAAVLSGLQSVDKDLETLPTLRAQVMNGTTVGPAMALRYEVVIEGLNSYRDDVAQYSGASDDGNQIRAAALFSDAKADVGYEQATAYLGLSSGQFGTDEREGFIATLHSQEQSLLSFLSAASADQRELVTDTVAGDAVQLSDTLVTQLSRGSATNVPADEVRRALGAEADLMRWVERRLDEGVAEQVTDYRDQVVRQAEVESVLVVVAIALALLVTVLLARMMSRSLRRLGRAADTVARRDLPRAVARLQTTGQIDAERLPELVAGAYDPIPVTSTDEIGHVANSFNGVHREAIRIAVEQAVQRQNVSATFIGLARRSQKLVDKMINRLDHVERDEREPERLAALFELDHLATRMRRNDENLLILADADAASPRLEDAALADVLAAAQSEIARYERIEIGPLNRDGAPGEAVMVRAAAVNDVVRLFAELMENAAAFSPPSRRVMISGRQVGEQVLVEIEDHGIGMTRQRRDELNARLVDPAGSNLGSIRMMGFAVVAKLAARHRIRVHLGNGRGGGTVVHAMLPDTLITIATQAPASYRQLAPAPQQRPAPVEAISVPVEAGAPLPRRTAELPARGAELPMRTAELPMRGSEPPARGAELPNRGAAPAGGRPTGPGQGSGLPTRTPRPAAPAATGPGPGGAEWFASSTARIAGSPVPAPVREANRQNWQAAADAALRAGAAQVTDRTEQGLPKRAPMAQLVPGGLDREPVEIPRSATGVRSFLSEYQRGVSTGRDRTHAANQPIDPNRTGES